MQPVHSGMGKVLGQADAGICYTLNIKLGGESTLQEKIGKQTALGAKISTTNQMQNEMG